MAKPKELRVRIDERIIDRFKGLCLMTGISVPKQIAALMKKFIEIQEANMETMRKLKK